VAALIGNYLVLHALDFQIIGETLRLLRVVEALKTPHILSSREGIGSRRSSRSLFTPIGIETDIPRTDKIVDVFELSRTAAVVPEALPKQRLVCRHGVPRRVRTRGAGDQAPPEARCRERPTRQSFVMPSSL
jgi:hypothetical protein